MRYKNLAFLNDTLLMIAQESQKGIVATNGKELIHVEYTDIDKQLYLNSTLVKVTKDGQSFYVSVTKGTEYIKKQ